jgi:CRP-like cAMP-binding protein
VPQNVTWRPLTPLRVAVLGRGAVTAGGRALTSALLENAARQLHHQQLLTAARAISPLDRRVALMLWLLAERWGEVDPGGAGARLTLPLTHRLLAGVVGARRQTITAALGRLASEGRVRRTAAGVWLLTGEPTPAVAVPLAA